MKLRIDWLALIVSCTAAAFSGLQWYEAHEMRQLQFNAAVSFDIDTEEAKRRIGIGLRNSGPGVAHIQAVEYYFDGRPVADISDTLSKMGLDTDRDEGEDIGDGDFLGPNGTTLWLIDYRAKSKSDEDHAVDLIENRTRVAVTYCTATDRVSECVLSTTPAPDKRHRSEHLRMSYIVGSCREGRHRSCEVISYLRHGRV